jgi:ribonuclease BN (tRNA processing enzyme)
MKLKILGCSGGIGGKLRTTSMLLDQDVLIDAGTGVGDLSLEELSAIDHVFLTHSHLDHIVSIPFMLDSVASMRDRPLIIYALEETLEALQQHIFNWKIWPDFRQIPNPQQPHMYYQTIKLGETVTLNGREITALPANHVIPAIGYQLNSGKTSLVFSGDTTTQDDFWNVVNRIDNLEYLIIETAFPNAERDLAVLSKHLCPSLLAEELEKLRLDPQIYITHLKPDESALTMQEIGLCVRGVPPRMLMNGQVFEF